MSSLDQVRQLLTACEQGSAAAVDSILDSGVDVDVTDEYDTTALQVAAANGHEHIVRLLLMRGAGLDKSNMFGWTAVMHAARHGHDNVVKQLLQNTADINAQSKLGASSMTLAARGGHLQTVKLLMEAGIDLNMSTGIGCSTCEFTPLMSAAMHGHDTVVRYLLDRGVDVNYRLPSTGLSALMIAALNGHMTTAQILVERGANPNLTNVNGQTALEMATGRAKREVKGYLERKTTNKPKTAPEDLKPDIIDAAKRGDLQCMREILEVDISQRDACSTQDGATPLMFAAMTGRLDMAQLLVEKGCDVNKQDSVSGWTALMQATYHGKKTVAKYLITIGADVTIPTKNGCTAFDMASLIDDVDTELYRLLAAKAMSVNKPEKNKKPTSAWSSKQNTTPNGTLAPYSEGSEDQPKSGLKAWWSRMSNRFRNLKLGRTFNFSNNRLAPLPPETCNSESTYKVNSSPKLFNHSQNAHMETNLVTNVDNSESSNTLATINSITSYETMLLETKKSASVYTLGINPVHANMTSGILKPVIPPFLPPPTFETDRPKMPPISNRRSFGTLEGNSTLNRTTNRPGVKFLQNISNGPNSNSPNSSGLFENTSPNSSGGASSMSSINQSTTIKMASSASSSTLTAGSGRKSGLKSSNDALFVPVQFPSARPPSFLANKPSTYSASRSHHTPFAIRSISTSSPNNSTNENPTVPVRKISNSKSASSKESTSTLTPSPSPTPKPNADTAGTTSISPHMKSVPDFPDDDDLGGILKKISLERYQPIFEEQEVDMEAFLTLTDSDLKELGISHTEPRRQILTAISELNSGKGRQMQQFRETMTNFQSTVGSRNNRNSVGSDSTDLTQWTLPDENRCTPATSKSRSS